jgi:hypothetical protein
MLTAGHIQGPCNLSGEVGQLSRDGTVMQLVQSRDIVGKRGSRSYGSAHGFSILFVCFEL